MAEAGTSSESGSEFLPLECWKANVWKFFGFDHLLRIKWLSPVASGTSTVIDGRYFTITQA